MVVMDSNGRYLLFMVGVVSAVNSMLQGYDSSMMSGLQILPSFDGYFHPSTALTSMNVAIMFLGSIASTPFTGPIADRFGRKFGLATAAIVAIVGAVLQGGAQNEAMFLIGRFLIGVAVNMGYVVAPAYVAEVTHPDYRVTLTGLSGAAWYVGGVMASGITYGTQYIDSTWAWRIPSLLQFIPSFLCLAALIGVPESPRWLIYKGRHDEAKAIIIKYHGCGDPESPVAALEYTEICDTLAFETSVQKTNAKTLVSTKGNRWRLGVAMSMGVFSQLSGNNIITYYLSDVLDAAGITGVQTQLGLNIGISLLNLFAAAIGSLFMNKFRRRPSFLISTAGMAIILIVVAILTKFFDGKQNASASDGTIFLIYLFYGFYSVVYTPLTYIYPTEVLSYTMRANGMAIFECTSHLVAFADTYVLPYAMGWSPWGVYLIEGLWCFIECGIIFFYFPETNGMRLEEIDLVFDGEMHIDSKVVEGEVVQANKVEDEANVNEKDIEAISGSSR